MKKLQKHFAVCGALILTLLAAGMPQRSFAQQGAGTLQGKVVDEASVPVIGASVVVKGSAKGASTDVDGSFTLSGLTDGDVLEVSYLGYDTQEVVYHGQTFIDVTLHEQTLEGEAVVVTALGIKRSEKALSYNVQKVGGNELTTVKDANFMNALVGKVAGVQISSSAAGAGGATRVVMRGMKSIKKSNAALYVIDGIPMYNHSFGGTEGGRMQGGTIGSESVADLNPEDIESISMLTGPSAAALYGSDAANGVVLITTKRGTVERTSVTISHNTMFSRINMMPQMQNRYGTSDILYSWGARQESSGYDPINFFRTGADVINSVSLSTGNSRNQTYMSVSTTNSSNIIPEAGYERYNFTARHTTKFAKDKLTFDFGAQYIIQKDRNMVSQGEYYSPIPALYLFPRGDDFDEIRLFERYDEGTGLQKQYWPYGPGRHDLQNPYWVQKRMTRLNDKRRYMLNASLKWQILDWLDITGRVRVDNSDYRLTRKLYAGTLETFAGSNGGYQDQQQYDRQFYGDVMLNIDKTFGDDWSLRANLGALINNQRYEMLGAAGDLMIANLFTVRNLDTAHNYKPMQEGWHDQMQSIFASIETSWRSMIYLTVTGRNDWASQLAYSKQSSFFYPSVGLSAVLSNMFNAPAWLPYLKVRASYTQVASAFNRWLTAPRAEYKDQSHTYVSPTTFPNTNLKPEDTRSWEVGLDARFFGKLHLDVTYYRSNTYNQLIDMPLAASTGYSTYLAQTGNVQNQGVELAFGYNNKWGDFALGTNFTYTFNENKIIELAHGMVNPVTGIEEDLSEIDMGYLGAAGIAPRVLLREGGSMSDIYVDHTILRDASGHVQINPTTGQASMTAIDPVYAGSTAPKHNLGWSSSLWWKDIDLGFTFTARIGGVTYSATQGILDYYGVSEATALLRDGKNGVDVNFGQISPQSYYQTIATAQGGHGAYYIYDATNVRLQELNLSYTLPRKWFHNKARLTLGFVAKNLWMIYCKAPFDPEVSAITGSNYYQGVDYFMLPTTRNFGFNVKLQF